MTEIISKKNIHNDDKAFEALFKDNYEKVYKASFFILFDGELAYEATQEAFLRAYEKIDSLKDKSKFAPWVCSIAINISKDILRKEIVERQKNTSIYNDNGSIKEFFNELIIFKTPDKIYEESEFRQKLEECLNELDPDLRKIINLRYDQAFTYEKIAKIMNTKIGTIKSKLHRANQQIAKKLINYY